jgi:hypothetical protein
MTTLVPMAADHDLDVRHAPFPGASDLRGK